MSNPPHLDAMILAQLFLYSIGGVGLMIWYLRDIKKPYVAAEAAARAAGDRASARKYQACINRQDQITSPAVACIAITICMAALYMHAHVMAVVAMLIAVWAISIMTAYYYSMGVELAMLQCATCLLPLLQSNQNVVLNLLALGARIFYIYFIYRLKGPTGDLEMLKFDGAIQLMLAAAVFRNQNAALFFVSNMFYFALLPIAIIAISWMRTHLEILPRDWSRNYVILTACVGVVCLFGPSVAINYNPFYSERPQIQPVRHDDGMCWACNEADAGTVGCGIGECYREFSRCIDGRYNDQCLPKYPEPEKCDCLDNDCNGVVDDGAVCDGYETDCTVCGLVESERFLIKKLF